MRPHYAVPVPILSENGTAHRDTAAPHILMSACFMARAAPDLEKAKLNPSCMSITFFRARCGFLYKLYHRKRIFQALL